MRNWTCSLFLLLVSCTASTNPTALPVSGAALLTQKGCVACHSVNGQPGIGPTFLKLYGRTETLADGSKVLVDDAYVRESILRPAAKVVQRYQPVMPAVPLTESELDKIVAHLKTLK